MEDKIIWSGKTSSYHHKMSNTPNPEDVKNGFRKVWFLDAQWSTCPVEVEDEVKALWEDYELGNDNYFYSTTTGSMKKEPEGKKAILQYVLEQCPDIEDDDKIIVHWWW